MRGKNILVLPVLLIVFCKPYGWTKEGQEEWERKKHPAEVQTTVSASPIDVSSKNYPPFGVAKIRSSLLPAAAIGAHYSDIFNIRQYYHYASGIVSDQAEMRYKSIIAEELRKAGYNTVEQSGLFGDDQGWRARFLIGAYIINAEYNTFGDLEKGHSEANLEVEWQIYDRETRKIAHDSIHVGLCKVPGVSSEAVFRAFDVSFRHFLSSASLINALDEYLIGKSSGEITTPSITYHPNYESSPENCVEYAQNAVVAVKTAAGHGSGFIFNEAGYAMTNYHVVEGIALIDAIMQDGKIIEAKVIATDPDKDLAIIKLSGTGYEYLALGDVNEVPVGTTIYAIGTPALLKLAQTVSRGIVSGYRIWNGRTFVQTDATVNPGNSGGPLIDEGAKVIGVVTFGFGRNHGYEELNFGVSINDAIESFNLRITE